VNNVSIEFHEYDAYSINADNTSSYADKLEFMAKFYPAMLSEGLIKWVSPELECWRP
jgi:hypothetical protein